MSEPHAANLTPFDLHRRLYNAQSYRDKLKMIVKILRTENRDLREKIEKIDAALLDLTFREPQDSPTREFGKRLVEASREARDA